MEIIPLAYVKHIMIDLVHNSDKFYKSTHRLYTRRDGRTNAPYMIPYTLRAMADTLDLPIADVARGTRDTARAVYGL